MTSAKKSRHSLIRIVLPKRTAGLATMGTFHHLPINHQGRFVSRDNHTKGIENSRNRTKRRLGK